jgi:hypothetical protein
MALQYVFYNSMKPTENAFCNLNKQPEKYGIQRLYISTRKEDGDLKILKKFQSTAHNTVNFL